MRSSTTVVGTTLIAVAVAHLVLYRGIFGIPRPDPHGPAEQQWLPFLLSAVVVLAASGLACRVYRSRLSAVGGAWIAALATELYFIGVDWLEVGWGNEIGHDIWFGDEGYWLSSGARLLVFGVAFAVVACASWGMRRDAHVHSAG